MATFPVIRIKKDKIFKRLIVFSVIALNFSSCENGNRFIYYKRCFYERVESEIHLDSLKKCHEIKYEDTIEINKVTNLSFLLNIEGLSKNQVQKANFLYKKSVNDDIKNYEYTTLLSSKIYYVHDKIGVVYSNSKDYSFNEEYILTQHYLYTKNVIDSIVILCRSDFFKERDIFLEENIPKEVDAQDGNFR